MNIEEISTKKLKFSKNNKYLPQLVWICYVSMVSRIQDVLNQWSHVISIVISSLVDFFIWD